MKRSQGLQPLSQDHYKGLRLVAQLNKALSESKDLDSLADTVVAFRESHLRPHFQAENELLLPVLAKEDPALGKRLASEHVQINAIVDNLQIFPETRKEHLAAFCRLLRAHIRFEEREVFPRIEQVADKATLQNIRKRLEDRNEFHPNGHS